MVYMLAAVMGEVGRCMLVSHSTDTRTSLAHHVRPAPVPAGSGRVGCRGWWGVGAGWRIRAR